MRRWLAAMTLALATLPAFAEAPLTSLRPPQMPAATAPIPVSVAPAPKRPQARPDTPVASQPVRRPPAMATISPRAGLRPHARPDGLSNAGASTSPPVITARAGTVQTAKPRTGTKRELRRNGAVCGDLDILGEEIGRIDDAGSCGIENAVRVQSVAGVKLSQGALLNCSTATALKTWVVRGVQPAFRKRDQVVQLQVAAHYACRGRNNIKGAPLSEHARGNAIDISAFVLKSGKVLTVLDDYSHKGPLGEIRRAACGTFGTVLGPGADKYHANHFHLDTARQRAGAYCH